MYYPIESVFVVFYINIKYYKTIILDYMINLFYLVLYFISLVFCWISLNIFTGFFQNPGSCSTALLIYLFFWFLNWFVFYIIFYNLTTYTNHMVYVYNRYNGLSYYALIGFFILFLSSYIILFRLIDTGIIDMNHITMWLTGLLVIRLIIITLINISVFIKRVTDRFIYISSITILRWNSHRIFKSTDFWNYWYIVSTFLIIDYSILFGLSEVFIYMLYTIIVFFLLAVDNILQYDRYRVL